MTLKNLRYMPFSQGLVKKLVRQAVIGRNCAVVCRDRREVNATFEFAVAYLKTIFTDTIKDSRYPWSIHTVSGGRILFICRMSQLDGLSAEFIIADSALPPNAQATVRQLTAIEGTQLLETDE